ncbi:hypothetical protein SAMN03159353_10492 [Cedecea sp. NFIX57]|nr:hypothetical protein SAMN03159353_10492 [Cedecea sp. NFIX57]
MSTHGNLVQDGKSVARNDSRTDISSKRRTPSKKSASPARQSVFLGYSSIRQGIARDIGQRIKHKVKSLYYSFTSIVSRPLLLYSAHSFPFEIYSCRYPACFIIQGIDIYVTHWLRILSPDPTFIPPSRHDKCRDQGSSQQKVMPVIFPGGFFTKLMSSHPP